MATEKTSSEAESTIIGKGNPVTALRLAALRNGYVPIPLAGKYPKDFDGWQRAAIDEAAVRSWPGVLPANTNTGVRTATTPAVDIDVKDEAAAEAVEALVRARFGNGAGRLMRRIGQAPKRAFLFRTEAPFRKLLQAFLDPGGTEHRIEILCEGQQLVVDGIHPDTRQPYEWTGGEPWTVARADLPELTAASARQLMIDAARLLVGRGWRMKRQDRAADNDGDDVIIGGHKQMIVEIAEKLWGPARPASRTEYRFGTHGSKVVNTRYGSWFDHEASEGGGVRDLIKKVRSKTAAGGSQEGKELVLVRAADVVARRKEWIWEGHLLRGGLELLTGIPGLGKSQVQCRFVASVTAEKRWPDGTPAAAPASVIMVTAEDALDTEVIPRLIAAGANRDRVHVLTCIRTDDKKRQFLLAEDLDELERAIARIGDVGLVTIDPITAYMGGTLDSHRATDVRSQLGPLKDFTERTNIAVSAITHPAKNAGQRAIDHFIGSQAFIAAARIGHACFEEMLGDRPTGRYLFTNPKNNPSEKKPTLAYRIETTIIDQDNNRTSISAPRAAFDEGTVNITADAIIAASREGKRGGDQDAVRQFLYNILADNGGSKPHKEIAEEAKGQHGFTAQQLWRAKKALGIESTKDGLGPWIWYLPIYQPNGCGVGERPSTSNDNLQ